MLFRPHHTRGVLYTSTSGRSKASSIHPLFVVPTQPCPSRIGKDKIDQENGARIRKAHHPRQIILSALGKCTLITSYQSSTIYDDGSSTAYRTERSSSIKHPNCTLGMSRACVCRLLGYTGTQSQHGTNMSNTSRIKL